MADMSGEAAEPPSSLVNIRTGPATDEERILLRNTQLARKATPEEVETWFAMSSAHMSEKAKSAFYGMTPENQYRVMYEGPMTDSIDSTEILYARVQRFMDMEAQLKKLANANAPGALVEKRKPKEKKISDLAVAIGKALVSTELPDEVPEEERRFAAPAGSGKPAVEKKPAPPMVGSRKGVGGIIEVIQKKYGMQKGDRAKVVAETKELWKIDGERTVPKSQCNQGWKWVLQGEDEAAKKKAELQARKKKEAEEAAAQKPQEEEAKVKAKAKAKADSDEKKGGREKQARSGSRRRSRSSSASRRRSRSRRAAESKRKSKAQAKGGRGQSCSSSRASSRGRGSRSRRGGRGSRSRGRREAGDGRRERARERERASSRGRSRDGPGDRRRKRKPSSASSR